ncbi:hypothetical protein FRC07_012869 [Ceratobasidium sp. 392]|nr:hypothetical protein FRC07_012869 [Ceratobasidium sp. 392]
MYTLAPKLLSRTGRQFYAFDKDVWSPNAKEGRAILAVMADKDLVFFKALSAFPHMTIYGNAVHDITVPYCTSLIEPHDPFTVLSSKRNRLAIKMDSEYRHVIHSFYNVPDGEDVPVHDLAKERQAERDAIPWYSPERYRSNRPLLPPQLRFRFPLNLLLYLILPFLIPLGLIYATVLFKHQSAESQKRLAELTTSPEADLSLGAALRSKVELAVAATIGSTDPDIPMGPKGDGSSLGEEKVEVDLKRRGSPESELERGSGTLPSPDPAPAIFKSDDPTTDPKNLALRTKPDPSDPSQPMFTPIQLEMIASLNSIPQLRKVQAYFPFVQNTHRAIVARDPGVLPERDDGFGVLKHWADRFVLE